MKKEHIAIGILGLFVFGYVLDYVAGPVSISLSSPFVFFTSKMLSQFPFTAVSITMRTLALFLATLLIFSYVPKKFLGKAVFLFCAASLLELYSIQQLATRVALVPIQWILTFTSTGVLLLVPTIVFFFLGVFHYIVSKMKKEKPILSS